MVFFFKFLGLVLLQMMVLDEKTFSSLEQISHICGNYQLIISQNNLNWNIPSSLSDNFHL